MTYDSAKNKSNIDKHGLSHDEAKLLDWDDDRKDYGEERCAALFSMKQRLYCVVYVDVKMNRRIISLRKANNREIDRYEKETN